MYRGVCACSTTVPPADRVGYCTQILQRALGAQPLPALKEYSCVHSAVIITVLWQCLFVWSRNKQLLRSVCRLTSENDRRLSITQRRPHFNCVSWMFNLMFNRTDHRMSIRIFTFSRWCIDYQSDIHLWPQLLSFLPIISLFEHFSPRFPSLETCLSSSQEELLCRKLWCPVEAAAVTGDKLPDLSHISRKRASSKAGVTFQGRRHPLSEGLSFLPPGRDRGYLRSGERCVVLSSLRPPRPMIHFPPETWWCFFVFNHWWLKIR